MFIKITDSETGDNKGSSGELVHYLEKENRQAAKQQPGKAPEYWFTNGRNDVQPNQVRSIIDRNVAKLLKKDAKFFLLNISPSQKELQHLTEKFGEKDKEEQLKAYTICMMDEYARNFKRAGVNSSQDLVWFGKLEHHRYYSYKDKEVRQGKKQNGARKEGDQLHIHVIVSRKDITNKLKLSPQNKSRGSNAEHSKKVGQFDRVAFKASGEKIFDQQFDFDRGLADRFEYANGLKNGTPKQRQALLKENNAAQAVPALPAHLTAKPILEVLLMPTQDYASHSVPGRKRRKRKGQDQGLTL